MSRNQFACIYFVLLAICATHNGAKIGAAFNLLVAMVFFIISVIKDKQP